MRVWFNFGYNYYDNFILGLTKDSWKRDNFKRTTFELMFFKYCLIIHYVDNKVEYDKFIEEQKTRRTKMRKRMGLE